MYSIIFKQMLEERYLY